MLTEDKGYKIYNDDYRNVVSKLKKGDVDLIITDPPYKHSKGGRGKFLLGDSLDRDSFNMRDLSDFGKAEIYEFLDSTRGLMLKPQWYVFCSEKQLVYYLMWCDENKFNYNLLTWNKPNKVLNRERYSTNIEYIVRIYGAGCALNKIDLNEFKEKTKYYSKYKTYLPIAKGKNKYHPSQKPLGIIDEIVELSSKEGDTILDTFMGSGTVIVSATKNNRKAIGVEKVENIFNKATERLEISV